MHGPPGADEAVQIAAAFLGDHWRDRVERAGTADELRAGFRDVFLRGLRPHPGRTLPVRDLHQGLEDRLGTERASVSAMGKLGVVEVSGISPSTAKADFAALVEVCADLGTHATLVDIEIEDKQPPESYRAGGTWSLRARCYVPLQNTLFVGDAPSGARSAIEHGRLVDDSERLRVDLVSCPLCRAEHAVFYNAKSHAQDREDVPFVCLACSRHECAAFGIPELSSYRIDLADRLPPKLARQVRRHRGQLAAWRAEPGSRLPQLDGVQKALWATVLVFTILLVLAWRSPEFDNPVFHGARTLATIACAGHAVATAAFSRGSSAALSWLPLTFAAVFALMIPVLVAMWN